MEKLAVERRAVDARALKFRVASGADFDRLVESGTDVFVGGEMVASFRVLPSVPADLIAACRAIEYSRTARTDGLVTSSRTLGFLPRVTLRRDFCTRSSMSSQHPGEHAVFCEYAVRATEAYRKANKKRFVQQEKMVGGVLPEWRIPGSVFTSGIVNQNNSLRYHRDSGNFTGLWSAMYAFSMDTAGGVLVLPELRLGFSFQRPALIMFDGAANVHGVTPIVRRSSMAWRYSIVFYAMKAMCNCLPMTEELSRIRKVKTRREVERSAGKKV